ncbi:MAG: hypothetical protein HUJ22_09575 [Gracilimonas sp.]|uniref:hypothetical protein n=1 Tax=Gracilimonas sp. TaxID=1974203 RepID=UPI001984C015|nr:hypothetical protein [Gracilimonas sp.]MBD3616811.1 hypothetical protein [Gracilimonas sp.]
MKTCSRKYILVLLSAALFIAFSMMHEFDWLIPASPIAVVSGMTSMPITDLAEESGSEDEIEYEKSFNIRDFTDIKYHKRLKSELELIVAQVLSPPPDMV